MEEACVGVLFLANVREAAAFLVHCSNILVRPEVARQRRCVLLSCVGLSNQIRSIIHLKLTVLQLHHIGIHAILLVVVGKSIRFLQPLVLNESPPHGVKRIFGRRHAVLFSRIINRWHLDNITESSRDFLVGFGNLGQVLLLVVRRRS